ncbi:enhancer of split M1 protein [Drosophila grimshawi]|uniref:GH19454 n=1 Tax=Drosophila grimshawi TaxID=7222 RepID=B4JGI4_DROGR|nr:enhancer of split M1 protein [Drosophila grimshawi]EDV93681.1 GH19454 [Drosophila grimshawi]
MKFPAITLCCGLALMSGIAGNSVSNNDTDCPQICPALHQPVCGFDGFNLKEFANPCSLKASNCRRERSALTTYTQTDMDWCSTQEVTNLQEQLKLNLDVGPCVKPCPMIYQPLCVSNGKYRGLVPSECLLSNYNCVLMNAGIPPNELLRVLKADSCDLSPNEKANI